MDYKLSEAERLIESLDDSEENELIKYYIKNQEEYAEGLRRQIEAYDKWFGQLSMFLPNGNPLVG